MIQITIDRKKWLRGRGVGVVASMMEGDNYCPFGKLFADAGIPEAHLRQAAEPSDLPEMTEEKVVPELLPLLFSNVLEVFIDEAEGIACFHQNPNVLTAILANDALIDANTPAVLGEAVLTTEREREKFLQEFFVSKFDILLTFV